MIKKFEKFEFFKKKVNDIYKRVTSNFNMLSHYSRFKKDIENDYHKIVKKYNISHVGVILDMTIDMVEKLDSELKNALNNHNLSPDLNKLVLSLVNKHCCHHITTNFLL